MSELKRRIRELSETHPELSSSQIAKHLGCHPSYVRCVWDRERFASRPKQTPVLKLHYERAYSALEELFIAITEEGYDVEAAITKAENILIDQAVRSSS